MYGRGVPGHTSRTGRAGNATRVIRAWTSALGRPGRADIVAGFVTGLFSIPEGMAYASIAGFNPVLGLYSGMLPTLVGSVFARTVLMATTLTSAIALSSQSVLAEAGLDPRDLHNVVTLTLMVGLIMAAFGVLAWARSMGFVSNAVMTGFTTGIALQIVVGVIKHATGIRLRARTPSANWSTRSFICPTGSSRPRWSPSPQS